MKDLSTYSNCELSSMANKLNFDLKMAKRYKHYDQIDGLNQEIKAVMEEILRRMK